MSCLANNFFSINIFYCIFYSKIGDLEKYFSRFGVVERVNLKYDPETGISRCFAFISFAEEEAVEEVLRQPMHIVNGRWAEPRRAKSRPVFKKLFVGGLDSSLNTDDIRDYFSRFGKVRKHMVLLTDKQRLFFVSGRAGGHSR